MKPRKKFRVYRAWADVGTHHLPFVFEAGPIWSLYGPLLHIWDKQVSPDLVQIEIRIPVGPRPARRRRHD
jgi:hypothetical protein